jgi:hypothetical protein
LIAGHTSEYAGVPVGTRPEYPWSRSHHHSPAVCSRAQLLTTLLNPSKSAVRRPDLTMYYI